MKKYHSFLLMLPFAIVTVSCGNSPEEQLIATYVQTIDNTKTDLNFDLKNLEKVRDITTKDSLDILKPTFEEKKAAKLKELKESLEKEKEEVENSKRELKDAEENEPYLVDIRKSTLEYRQETLEQTKEFIELYKTDCKGTFLEPMYNAIQKYEAAPGKLLGTEYTATYTIENPLLNNAEQEITNTYILNEDRTKVLSTF